MAGTFDISTINVISPNGLVTKPLTVDNYGYAKIGDERVGVTPTNWIINGQFDVWQRGTSGFLLGGSYNADRFLFYTESGAGCSVTQQTFAIGQTDVPNNPTYYQRSIVVSGGLSTSLAVGEHKIENVAKLAGKTVSISFWAKADSSKNMSVEFYQSFGTGGSSAIVGIGVQKFSLTTSWQRFTKIFTNPSVNGKTIGSNNFLALRFWFDAGSTFGPKSDNLGNQSGTFDIANVCLVEGSVPVECPNEPYAEVLRKCQRYYWRTGGDAAYFTIGTAVGISSTYGMCDIKLPVKMRITPTAVEYSTLRLMTNTGGTITITGISLNTVASSSDLAVVDCTVASGLTSYYSYLFTANNSTSAYLAFTAEL